MGRALVREQVLTCQCNMSTCQITKYQIKVIVNVKLIKTDNTNNLEFTIEHEGDYVVADKFSQTLNNEKKLIHNIIEKISESIIGEIINKLNVI